MLARSLQIDSVVGGGSAGNQWVEIAELTTLNSISTAWFDIVGIPDDSSFTVWCMIVAWDDTAKHRGSYFIVFNGKKTGGVATINSSTPLSIQEEDSTWNFINRTPAFADLGFNVIGDGVNPTRWNGWYTLFLNDP